LQWTNSGHIKMAACLSEGLVERYLNGACSSEEQRTVEMHSGQCSKCREQIERTQSDHAPFAADPLRTIPIDANSTVAVPQQTVVGTPEPATAPPPRVEAVPPTDDAVKKDFESMFEGYKIISEIGAGGGGTVWRAFQLSTQRHVALKVLAARAFTSEKARLRFEREVELTARLEHPNIARIYDSGLNRGVYYYAMELFEGEHLNKHIKYYQLSQRDTLELIYAVCQAVQYAHQRGVIHRDLKPSNVIVTPDGQPHIVDFGLAKALGESKEGMTVSIDGQVTGTPAYMSPEQAAGHLDAIDTRTDVYSLGAILYHVLTGRWPCDLSGSYFQVLKSIQEQDPVRPSRIVPDFDTDIEAILLKALAKNPDERYQSASEFAHDIRCWLDGLPILARSVDTIYLLKKFMLRHRAATVIAASLLVIILATTYISLHSYTRARAEIRDLQRSQQILKKEKLKDLAYANRVLFLVFLLDWQSGRNARAQQAAGFLSDKQLKAAAYFLLDPRPFDEKQKQFHDEIAAEKPAFWEFIVGEYHHRNNDRTAAMEAYQRCLKINPGASEFDDWFKNSAKRNINELLTEEATSQSRPGTNSGDSLDGH
jgi:serine/threonine protein kinase